MQKVVSYVVCCRRWISCSFAFVFVFDTIDSSSALLPSPSCENFGSVFSSSINIKDLQDLSPDTSSMVRESWYWQNVVVTSSARTQDANDGSSIPAAAGINATSAFLTIAVASRASIPEIIFCYSYSEYYAGRGSSARVFGAPGLFCIPSLHAHRVVSSACGLGQGF